MQTHTEAEFIAIQIERALPSLLVERDGAVLTAENETGDFFTITVRHAFTTTNEPPLEFPT